MVNARGFFQNMKFPDGFFRAKQPFGLEDIGQGIDAIFAAHPIQPGANQGVNNYVLNPASANLSEFCLLYTNFVNNTVRGLYPNPTGVLRDALNANLNNFFSPLPAQGCTTQFFPYGN
jgi:unspecific peroxygenase